MGERDTEEERKREQLEWGRKSGVQRQGLGWCRAKPLRCDGIMMEGHCPLLGKAVEEREPLTVGSFGNGSSVLPG